MRRLLDGRAFWSGGLWLQAKHRVVRFLLCGPTPAGIDPALRAWRPVFDPKDPKKTQKKTQKDRHTKTQKRPKSNPKGQAYKDPKGQA
jgi:hypothetical protein